MRQWFGIKGAIECMNYCVDHGDGDVGCLYLICVLFSGVECDFHLAFCVEVLKANCATSCESKKIYFVV